MKQMKKVYIIHRWDGMPDSDWYLWLKKELEEKTESEVRALAMPDTEVPVIEKWVVRLKEVVPQPDENTYFIGHSIGCQTIMRYLAALQNVNVGGALFVAGWLYLKNLEDEEVEKIAAPWLRTPIDFEKVKASTGNVKIILSDNDPYNHVEENKKAFEEKLNAEVLVEKHADHFTDTKYPIILEKALEVLNL